MKLLVTRHGETEGNVKGIRQGHRPGVLTENGIKQARDLAEKLHNARIDFIYSSDLARAADTAKEIVKLHPDTPLILTEQLRERDFGEFTGTPVGSVDTTTPENGESIPEFYERTRQVLKELTEKHAGQTVLIVAHNGNLKAITSIVNGMTWQESKALKAFKNTEVIKFEL